MSSSDSYTNVLLKEMNGKFDAVLEIAMQLRSDIADTVKHNELDVVRADIKVIKTAVTETNHQVQDHEVRLTKLETAPR